MTRFGLRSALMTMAAHCRRNAARVIGALAVLALPVARDVGAQAGAPPPSAASASQPSLQRESVGRVDRGALAARVDSVFDRWRGTDRPGCTVGVRDSSGVALERAYGMADLERGVPLRPTTVMSAASIGKQVTALAVLLLVRDGRLALDDDVRRYLPELPDYRARYGRAITVRHLLAHTSGLRDLFELLILARGRFEEDRITDADALAVVARQAALNFAPGTEYGYSNTNYWLAARLVSRVSGQSFAGFVAGRIFAPLGMTSTRFRDDAAALVPGRASGYERVADGSGAWRTSVQNYDVVGPINLLTTVGDLLRWSANLERPMIGDTALVRQMLTPTTLAGGDTTAYGFGLSLARDRGVRVAEHEGRDPGFRAYLGWYADAGLTVALLCNTASLDPVGLGHDVAGLALGLAPQAPVAYPRPAAAGPQPDPNSALRWAGVYVEPTTRRVVELTARDGALYTDRVGGVRIEALDARRGWLVNGPLELLFAATTRTDDHPSYRVRARIPGRRPQDVFVWRASAAPRLDRAALAPYAGTYASPELDATYRVEAGDSTLTLRAQWGGAVPGLVARPVFPDGFVSGQYTVEFLRRKGRVTGFAVSHPRALGVTFVRVLTPP